MKKLLLLLMVVLCLNIVFATDFVSFGGKQQEQKNETIIEVSREEAITAIQNSENAIEEMRTTGFSVVHQEDLSLEAQRALQRADYAQVLKQKQHDDPLVEEARIALEGLNWQGFTYNEVLKYTDEIAKKKESAYEVHDSLLALKSKMEDYREQGIDLYSKPDNKITGFSSYRTDVKDMYSSAATAFNEERYEEADEIIQRADSELEARKAEHTSIKTLAKASQGFVKTNSWRILAAVILASVVAIFGHRTYLVVNANNKLLFLESEKKALGKLMEKAQKDRYETASISDSLYQIKMNKYRRRLLNVDKQVPIAKAILKGEKELGWFKRLKK